jgi:hypothetical protein
MINLFLLATVYIIAKVLEIELQVHSLVSVLVSYWQETLSPFWLKQATCRHNFDPEKPKSWPRFLLRVDHEMCTYLTSGKKTKLGLLSSSLKVWVLLKVQYSYVSFSICTRHESLVTIVLIALTWLNENNSDCSRFYTWCIWIATIFRRGRHRRAEGITSRLTTSQGRRKIQTVRLSY